MRSSREVPEGRPKPQTRWRCGHNASTLLAMSIRGMRELAKSCAYAAGVPAYASVMRYLLDRASSDAARVRSVRHVAFRGWQLQHAQIESEILMLLSELRERSIEHAVEIGTANGGTLCLLMHVLKRGGKLVSVDLPGGEFGAGYPRWKAPLLHALAVGHVKLRLLRADSHLPATRQAVEVGLGGQADFIMIDGDHSYQGAKHDYEMYRDLVRPGGLLAFHDIVPGAEKKVGGVPRLWEELRNHHGARARELVADWHQGGYGIGLLEV